MAVLTVEKTIGAAIAAASAGDVVAVPPGVYRETVSVNKAITLRGEPGAIIDGGWDGKTKTNTFAATLGITADGATVDGLAVRNCPGRGISVNANRVTVRECSAENCYKGGLGANPPGGLYYEGLLIENNLILNVGLERLVTGGGSVNGSLLFTDVRDSVIRGNTVVGGLGEGINVDRNSRGCVFEGNTVINCAHAGIYVNCAQENVVRNNVVIYSGATKPVGKSDSAPAGILIGDEGQSRQSFEKSRGNEISGNVVVGCSPLFQVRNNATNYSTTLDEDTSIYNNTFVAGPLTLRGVDMAENVQGAPHRAGHFFDNAIDMTGATASAVIAARTTAAVDCHHNGWSVNPTKDVRGEGDVIGPLGLANPTAALRPEWGVVDVGYDVENYRPAPGSALIGAGSDGGVIGALLPRPVEPPPPPPPNPNLWIAERLSAIWGRLEEVGLEVGALADEVDALAAEIEPGE